MVCLVLPVRPVLAHRDAPACALAFTCVRVMTHLQSSLYPFFSLRASEIPDAAEVTKAVELRKGFSLFQHRKEKKMWIIHRIHLHSLNVLTKVL